MKCKHPEIFHHWVTQNGFSVYKYGSGLNDIKLEYVCMVCGKIFKKKPNENKM